MPDTAIICVEFTERELDTLITAIKNESRRLHPGITGSTYASRVHRLRQRIAQLAADECPPF